MMLLVFYSISVNIFLSKAKENPVQTGNMKECLLVHVLEKPGRLQVNFDPGT